MVILIEFSVGFEDFQSCVVKPLESNENSKLDLQEKQNGSNKH